MKRDFLTVKGASVVRVVGEFASNDESHIQNEKRNHHIANGRSQPSGRKHLVNAPQHEGHRRDQPFEELNGMHPDSRMKTKPREADQNERNSGSGGMKTMRREVAEDVQQQKQRARHQSADGQSEGQSGNRLSGCLIHARQIMDRSTATGRAATAIARRRHRKRKRVGGRNRRAAQFRREALRVTHAQMQHDRFV